MLFDACPNKEGNHEGHLIHANLLKTWTAL
jgi:hypothetical protein